MNLIGRKIYFDTITGDILVNTGDRKSTERETTLEEDIQIYSTLTERNINSFDVVKLEYGQFHQDFDECIGYRINPETRELEFSYPDPNAPVEPQPYRPPLSELVTAHNDYLIDVDYRLTLVELGLA